MTAPDAGLRADAGPRADADLRAPHRPSLRVQLLTPGDWTEHDLNPSTRRASIRRAVRSAARHNPALGGGGGGGGGVRLMSVLEQITRRAHEAGAFYCASLVLGDASGDVLVATALMQLSGDSTVALDFSAAELCAGLASVIGADPDWAGADVGVMALPFVGPAVRVCVVAVGVFVQYIVPLRAGGELLLSMSCPCPAYVTSMTELFDAMAASLSFES